MAHSSYPTETDLIDRLTGAGADETVIARLQEMMTLSDAMAAAKDDWETETLWTPYLAGPASTKSFNPPAPNGGCARVGYRLSLPSPLLNFTSMTANGRTFVQGTDFVFGPEMAAIGVDPYLWVTFRVPVYGAPGSIQITGQWGRETSLPDNVWDMLLQRSLMTNAPELAFAITGGATEIKTDIFSTKFGGDGPLTQQVTMWGKRWDRLVASKKRTSF